MNFTAVRRRSERGDEALQRRLDVVLALSERFVHDLGLLMAGETASMQEYVAPEAAARLHAALATADTGLRLVPRFSEYAQVRIDGDLLNADHPVRATVEFADLSEPDVSGLPVHHVRPRRRVRLRLLFDGTLTTLLDHRVELA